MIVHSRGGGGGCVCVETLQRFLQTGSARLLVLREGRSCPGEAPPPPPCSPFTPASRLVSTSRLPHPPPPPPPSAESTDHQYLLSLLQTTLPSLFLLLYSRFPFLIFLPLPCQRSPGRRGAKTSSGASFQDRPRCLFR